MGPEISPVKAPSLAHPIFCAPTRMFEPLTASTAAVRFVKGGQITISQCEDFSTSGRNFSKNCVVSAGVLYIFQLPAMTGVRIIVLRRYGREKTRSLPDPHPEVLGDRLPDIAQ